MWSYGVARLRLPVCATTVDRKQTGCFGLLVFEICTNKQYENSEREHIHMYIHTEYGTIRKKPVRLPGGKSKVTVAHSDQTPSIRCGGVKLQGSENILINFSRAQNATTTLTLNEEIETKP